MPLIQTNLVFHAIRQPCCLVIAKVLTGLTGESRRSASHVGERRHFKPAAARNGDGLPRILEGHCHDVHHVSIDHSGPVMKLAVMDQVFGFAVNCMSDVGRWNDNEIPNVGRMTPRAAPVRQHMLHSGAVAAARPPNGARCDWKADMEKLSETEGCFGGVSVTLYEKARVPRTDVCRTRSGEFMAATSAGRARLEGDAIKRGRDPHED